MAAAAGACLCVCVPRVDTRGYRDRDRRVHDDHVRSTSGNICFFSNLIQGNNAGMRDKVVPRLCVYFVFPFHSPLPLSFAFVVSWRSRSVFDRDSHNLSYLFRKLNMCMWLVLSVDSKRPSGSKARSMSAPMFKAKNDRVVPKT